MRGLALGIGSVGGHAKHYVENPEIKDIEGKSPFSFYVPLARAGDTIFAFRAPAKGALIVYPSIIVGAVSGDMYITAEIANEVSKPIEVASGVVRINEDVKVPPDAVLKVTVSGNGEMSDVWITYYA